MKGTFLDSIPWLKSHQPPLIDIDRYSQNWITLNLFNYIYTYYNRLAGRRRRDFLNIFWVIRP